MLVSSKIENKRFAFSCWSEFENLKKVAICKPTSLNINTLDDKIRFGFNDFVTATELMRNYEDLYLTFLDHGIQVYDFCNFISESEENLFNQCINRVYTRDVAAILGDSVFFGTAQLQSRIQEFSISQKILQKIMRTTTQPQPICDFSVEFGDLLILRKGVVLINFGLRTNPKILEFLLLTAWARKIEEVNVIFLPDKLQKIHLDLVCNIVSERVFSGYDFLKKILVTTYRNSGTIETHSLEEYLDEKEFRCIWFDDSYMDTLITNYLVINNNLIFTNKKYKPILERKFASYDVEIFGINLEGFEKGGGSMRCLTLPLERDKNDNIMDG